MPPETDPETGRARGAAGPEAHTLEEPGGFPRGWLPGGQGRARPQGLAGSLQASGWGSVWTCFRNSAHFCVGHRATVALHCFLAFAIRVAGPVRGTSIFLNSC